jgi:putative inorganic carbon (hco3(-)) transporter
MIRSETWIRLLLSLLFLYLLGAGSTFIGLLTPQLQIMTLVIIAVVLVLWLWRRRKSGWLWHHTPLDVVMPLWIIAFAVSILANPEIARRSMIGLWYVGVYIGTWYILYDAVANRAIKHDAILDGLMFGGLIVLAAGYLQISKVSFDLSRFELPRPGGTIGNPNSLGTYLVIMTVLSTARYLTVRDRLARIVLGGYGFSTLLLLFLTFSRGAWVGGIAAFGALALLILQSRGLISPGKLRERWQIQSSNRKIAMISGGVITAIMLVVVAFLLIQSINAKGRSPDLRLTIYENTVKIIKEEPITGHGLFTYGQQLSRYQSQPPKYPHSHAHNLILHVQTELGVFGSIALLATLIVIGSSMIRNWRDVSPRHRMPLAGAIAASVGFGVHHLLDTTMMMPAIMLMGLLVVMLSTMPGEPKPVTFQSRRTGHLLALVGLWVGLLATGFWNVSIYSGYYDALFYAISDEENPDYRGAAERIQVAVDADPNMAIYHQQLGLLYGMVASEGHVGALELAIPAFERFVELEPDHAAGWANLAALYWQNEQEQLALDTMLHAQSLARGATQLHFQVARYAEALGQDDLAKEYYRSALWNFNRLWPAWEDTPLSREVAAEFNPSAKVRLVFELTNQTTLIPAARANTLWVESGLRVGGSVEDTILRVILASRSELEDDVELLLKQADDLAEDYEDRAWVHLGRAEVARVAGDAETAENEIILVREEIKLDIGRADFIFGGNIAAFQFLRMAFPRQFLPQVFFPVESAALHYLLNDF